MNRMERAVNVGTSPANAGMRGSEASIAGRARTWRLSRLAAGALACVAALGATGALAVAQSGEQKNMTLVGHDDLQGRPAYQPNFIDYPDGRTIAFIGTHGGSAPNPLNGGAVEANGTMIVDITDPRNPVEKFHIPGTTPGTQMVRLCLGSDLPNGVSGHVYMMRNFAGGYETWDVTDVTHPVGPLATLSHIRSTHKFWWECNTGIAYMPGSKDDSWGQPLWRQRQSMVIVDWRNPAAPPIYIRTFGLPGGQPEPNGSGPIPPSLHGPISAHEHPQAAMPLVHGVTADDVVGNRIYAAYGVGSNGVIQILDRKKLLTPAYGGTYTGDVDNPTNEELLYSQVGILYLSPDQGGHTSMPVFGLAPKSLQDVPQKRDIVIVTSEAGNCTSQHWAFLADVSTENSIDAQTGTAIRQNPWQGPMILSTLWVDPHAGDRYPRGDYCLRGQRFGTHSVEENFNNPFYGKLTFTAYFNAGVRAWDIRDPQGPMEVGFYVPAAPNNTYMTNNVEVDNRGNVIIVDRLGNGMDILQLHGPAAQIGYGQR